MDPMNLSFVVLTPTQLMLLEFSPALSMVQTSQMVPSNLANPSTVPIHMWLVRSLLIILMKKSGSRELSGEIFVQFRPSKTKIPPKVVPIHNSPFGPNSRVLIELSVRGLLLVLKWVQLVPSNLESPRSVPIQRELFSSGKMHLTVLSGSSEFSME